MDNCQQQLTTKLNRCLVASNAERNLVVSNSVCEKCKALWKSAFPPETLPNEIEILIASGAARSDNFTQELHGLGDTIETITKVTGIKRLVEFIARMLKKDCGCTRRKVALNRLIPYRKRKRK